jgi:hypothetical protein
MKTNKIIGILFAASAVGGLLEDVHAQNLNSIDFTPVDGTSWASSPSSVRLNFGEGIGYGTVTFSDINGGSFGYVLAPFAYNAAPYSSYNGPTTLSSGAVFAPESELIFTINPGSGAGLAGFEMTVTLDSGNFTDGSVFSARSLGRSGDNSQYLMLGSGLSSPDSVQLPTDGSGSSDLGLVDPAQSLYGPVSNGGASKGLAYGISGNSFTASFLTTTGYQPGGVALTIATPTAVPEPTAAALLCLGSFGLLFRRRH